MIDNRATAALRGLVGRASTGPDRDRISELTRRVEHLEAALEGLQDAVYRQDVVHDRQIADLRERQAAPSPPPSPRARP
jgi:hypothetical protein